MAKADGLRHPLYKLAACLGAALLLSGTPLSVFPVTTAGAATPTFVQARANEVNSGTTNNLAFNSANTAGNLIVVYAVWNNTGTVALSDTRGNTYTSVAPATRWNNNTWSSQVFYAKNIVAGTNTVQATFGTSINAFGIIYIHEYSGISKTNPFDVTASAIGSSSAMNSGSATTTNANDLIFGGGASINNVNQPGSGFTTRSTSYGNRTEDKTVTTVGSYNATATQNSNGWVMHMVAFRADPGTSDTTPPSTPTGLTATAVSTSQINLAWNPSSDNAAVAGYKVFRNGTQVGTPGTTLYQDTGLTGATTYNYTVSVYDSAGNNSGQSVGASATTMTPPPDNTPPSVTLTAPSAGATVQGQVAVSANASDDVGVVGVQFLMDGVNLSSEDTTAPYDITWDTTSAVNGSHTLAARARDAAGNLTTTPPISVTVNNPAVPSGLAAGYALDEVSGTSAADASGHGLNGTLTNGPTWAVGRYGNAVNVDGVNDYVDLGNPAGMQFTGSMTISAWVFSSAFPGDDAPIVSKRGAGELGYQLDTTIDMGPRTIGFKLTNASGGTMFRYGATTLQLNTWYHITGIYNAAAGTLNVYLNGQLDNGALLGTVTSTQQNSSANVNIGRRPSGGFYFNGRIDNVRLYNRALTASENQTDMNTALGSGGSPDPTPPTVSISSPASGAQVNGIVTVTAAAADNVGVVGVQFVVDGVNAGAEDLTNPYAFNWDTRTVTNGAHTLIARAPRCRRQRHQFVAGDGQRSQHQLLPERGSGYRLQPSDGDEVPSRRATLGRRAGRQDPHCPCAIYDAQRDVFPADHEHWLGRRPTRHLRFQL